MSAFAALGGAHLAALDPIRDTEKSIKKSLARDDWRRAYAPEPRTISTLDALIAVEDMSQYDIERERIMRKRRSRSLILAATRDYSPRQRRIVWLTLKGLEYDEIAVELGLASAASVRALMSKISASVRRAGGRDAVRLVEPQRRLDLCCGGDA